MLAGSRQERPAAGQGPSHRVLIVGAARSGTTWVGEVLARTDGAAYLHEPDSADWVPFALRARAGMGLLPAVDPDAAGPPRYAQLWDAAFSARRRPVRNRLAVPLFQSVPRSRRSASGSEGARVPARVRMAARLAQPRSSRAGCTHLIVKSVQVPLALEWLTRRFDPAVVMVRRHPLDIVASRLQFGQMFLPDSPPPLDERSVTSRIRQWHAPPRPIEGDPFADMVWIVGFTVSAYDEVVDAHPEFHVVNHEELCSSPVSRFRELASAVDLDWTDQCEDYLRFSDTEGTGFSTNRVASTQGRTWPRRLSGPQLATARRILAEFPLARRYPDVVE